MKLDYSYIHFREIEPMQPRKTKLYSCRNNKSSAELGKIVWYGPWRQYCFFPNSQTVFNLGCLNDINHFIKQLMADRAK